VTSIWFFRILEEECVCSVCNILINGKIIKELPGSVASGTSYIINLLY